ncbi:MAG TPA: glycosyltransferase family 4 protein [Candidatus Polarisedimenticolia bacterium]|nr:glycosyltransferase family 4 protein [Candidatus Polarisedimenticolia bacterium]
MRIAYVSAGAGGMLCGSCLHDNTLAAALQRAGHDVALIPTYTPLRTDEADVSLDRIFYPAISIYLQSRWAWFRGRHPALERVLDHPALVRLIARRDWSTKPQMLGALALSVLAGEAGGQAKELEKLASWLGGEFRPEVIHLTNSLFLGMARALRAATGAPIVCSVQGEDLFLDELMEPFRSRVLEAMRRKAADADAFVSPSLDYAGRMRDLLGLPTEKVHVVPLGLRLEGHGDGAPRGDDGRFVIGYLARISPEKGLHLLAEGFHELAAGGGARGGEGSRRIRLRVAGHLRPRDRGYLDGVRRSIRSWGLEESFEYVGEPDREGKIRFLSGLDVFSVPTVYRESKGLSVLEAMANGVPVAQPRHGSFPEMVEGTGGGLLFEPGSPVALAETLRQLRDDPARRRELGRLGREGVARLHGDETMAGSTVQVYLALMGRREGGGGASCTS